MRERARISRGGAGRHSRTMARGQGDARDHRRENQRLTEKDLDGRFLEVNKDGQISLTLSIDLATALGDLLQGSGLSVNRDGALAVDIGLNLGFDAQGRLAVNVGNGIGRIVDSSGGTVDPSGEVTGANANSIATLSAKINQALDTLGTAVKL